MFRIILLVVLILLAIPLFHKVENYFSDGIRKAKTLGETGVKFIKYGGTKEK